MRVLAIRGCNLASIAGDFAIDFETEPLAGSGIFAITGPTGAGKSTLLDAVCLALFNDIPRLRAAPDRSQVGESDTLSAKDTRAILRHGTGEGFAEVDFAMPGGARYRARWSVKRARGRADGRIQNYDHQFTRLDTDARLGGTRTETLAAIRDVIGLSADQFSRAVLLAQGDFEAFIRADANERAVLLERLTGSEIYAKLGQRAWDKATALRSSLDAIRRDIAVQNGLDDEQRADAEVKRDTAVAAEQAVAARLGALNRSNQWELRSAELGIRIETEEQAVADALAAVDAAAPRQAALVRDRAALGFASAWQAVADAERQRNEAGTALQRSEAAVVEAQQAEAAKVAAESEAQALRSATEAQEKQLAPAIAEAHALDLRLTEAAHHSESLDGEARKRAAALADATTHEAEARRTQDALEAAHASHVTWLAAHAGYQQIAARESELADNVDALTSTERTHAAKADHWKNLAEQQAAALVRWNAAQETLVTREANHASASQASNEAEAALPPETRLTELTAERDDLAHVERALGDWQRAQEDLEQADNALIAARAREAGIVARTSTLAEAIDLISQGMPALVARQSEARRACALSEAAADEAAQILRAGLEEGQPCPVCGATEHRLSALDALLGEQHIANRRHAEALDAEVTQKQREQVAAQTEQAGLSRQADALAGELAELTQAQTNAKARHVALTADLVACARAANLPDAAATLAPALAARRQAGDAELAALSQARMVATSARQAEQAAREQRDTARDNHTAARDSLQSVTRAIEEVDRDLADLARDRERLSVTLAQALMPLGDIQHLPDPLAALRKAAADWRSHAQGRDEAAMSLPALRTALSSAGEALASARARANDADKALSQARADHLALLTKRSGLLDGETVAAVSERLAAALASAARCLDTTRAAREAAALARSAAEAHAAAALTRRDEAVTDHTARDADLAARLAAAGLDSGDVARVAAAGSAAIDAEAAALDALAAALGERRAVLTRCRDDLATHETGDRPVLLGEELAEALANATEEHTEAASNRTEAEFILRRDDEVRERTARLRADLSRETAAAEVWLKLADLIGDATGNRFRRFAQGLTLDRLLEHGNARLADLKPRYTLERGRGGDMMIQVIDNDMAGQIRGLHNLSGGERFLVSLALALGLAEMSTAGGVRIESLFIDEGFGALDPASLGQAVALLEHLHASGRRVGVISHVEELKERIPVKIEVIPTGRGTSEIAVTAG